MRLLLDTHVMVWFWNEPEKIGSVAYAAITHQPNVKVVSAASAVEAAIKAAQGRLQLPGDIPEMLMRSGFDSIPVTVSHAVAAGALPPYHKDPFDRMLVAQALEHGYTLVTADARLADYGVAILVA